MLSKRSWSIHPNKETLRAHFRALRHALSPSFRHAAAQAVADHFISHQLFQKSQHIACYVAYNNELDCLPLMRAIWNAGKKCYLPVLAEGKTLQFVRYAEGDVLQANKYNILEPLPSNECIVLEKLDVVLVPLIAFDRLGHRLGTGGGYYDRTFASLYDRIKLVGVGYSVQEADKLPHDDWDIKLCGVVTEKELFII